MKLPVAALHRGAKMPTAKVNGHILLLSLGGIISVGAITGSHSDNHSSNKSSITNSTITNSSTISLNETSTTANSSIFDNSTNLSNDSLISINDTSSNSTYGNDSITDNISINGSISVTYSISYTSSINNSNSNNSSNSNNTLIDIHLSSNNSNVNNNSISSVIGHNRKPSNISSINVNPKVTFDEVVNGMFRPASFNSSWLSNTEIEFRDSEGNLMLFDIDTGNTTMLARKSDFQTEFGTGMRLMGLAPNNRSWLLIAYDIEKLWRHSFLARYSVLDLRSGQSTSLKDKDKLRFAEWMPHQKENRLAFSSGNALFFQNFSLSLGNSSSLEIDKVPVEEEELVLVGVPDWVYEEEVLASNKAAYYSPAGGSIAYTVFNDTAVKEFRYTRFGSPEEPRENQYPRDVRVRFPKVGTPNPTVKLWVKKLGDEVAPKEVIPPPDVLAFGEHIYTAAKWSKEDTLNIIWMNRVQSRSSVSKCEEMESIWQCTTEYTLAAAAWGGSGWLNLFEPPVYSGGEGHSLLQIQPIRVSNNNNNNGSSSSLHYKQLVRVDNGNTTLVLTNATFVVTKILGWNEKDHLAYFVATGINEPGERHLYSVPDNMDQQSLKCLTCNLSMPFSNISCGYSFALLSPDFRHYIHVCEGPEVPMVVLRSITMDHAVVAVMEDNVGLRERLAGKVLPDRVFLQLESTKGEYRNYAKLLLPPGIDPTKKYPTVVSVYAGPGSQRADRKWAVGWGDYLSTHRQVVYVWVDGRGSGLQSEEYLFEVQGRLGDAEVEDQIAAVEELKKRLKYIDAEKTGIWGWSYGGYVALMTLAKDIKNVFACGISVAPVTSWLFYDSVYTERHMGLLEEASLDSYANYSSLLTKVEKLRNKTFQLTHGSADDNVHLQHSMQLSRALQLADIHFEQQVFPEENHRMTTVGRFLHGSFDRFWAKCFRYEL